ncbi:MAG: small multi-drug export protein [Oscillospiraceae bacterium]|nr:small multi-drug export protein [Oscillospiraceae bacterium]
MTVTFLISMLPVVELRGGLPYGQLVLGLDYPLALLAAIIGNLFPIPFIILFIKNIFSILRAKFKKMDGFITRIEDRAHLKSEVVKKYGAIGLCLLVAIPLPGTGAWTGALVAALMGLDLKRAMPSIVIGVLIAAAIMTGVTFGVIHLT